MPAPQRSGRARVLASAAYLLGVCACGGSGPAALDALAEPESVETRAVPRSHYLYALTYLADNDEGFPIYTEISAYAIDPDTGALRPVPGAPFRTRHPLAGIQLVADPLGRFLFAVDGYGGRVSVFGVDAPTGALEEIPDSPVAVPGGVPVALAVHPSGRLAYLAGWTTSIFELELDRATGVFREARRVSGPVDATSLAMDPRGRLVYAGDDGTHGGRLSFRELYGYRADAGTGRLSPAAGSPFPTGDGVRVCAVHPGGSFVYGWDDGLTVFRMDPETGIPLSLRVEPSLPVDPNDEIVFDTEGRFAYTSHGNAFTVDRAHGGMAPLEGSPFDVDQGRPHLDRHDAPVVVDPSGRFVYFGGPGGVAAFVIDHESGALRPVDRPIAARDARRFAIVAAPQS